MYNFFGYEKSPFSGVVFYSLKKDQRDLDFYDIGRVK